MSNNDENLMYFVLVLNSLGNNQYVVHDPAFNNQPYVLDIGEESLMIKVPI